MAPDNRRALTQRIGVRLAACMALGAVVALASMTYLERSLAFHVIAGWTAATTIYGLWTWLTVRPMNEHEAAEHARERRSGRRRRGRRGRGPRSSPPSDAEGRSAEIGRRAARVLQGRRVRSRRYGPATSPRTTSRGGGADEHTSRTREFATSVRARRTTTGTFTGGHLFTPSSSSTVGAKHPSWRERTRSERVLPTRPPQR